MLDDRRALVIPQRRLIAGVLTGHSLSFRGFAARFAVLFALASLPVLLNANLPLFDYPNHLARMYLLNAVPPSPLLQRFYAIDWKPLPNLAMDLTVPWLARVLPLELAGKFFILATLFLLTAGPALVHRVLSRTWSNLPLLAFLLLYGRILLAGYVNFLFGLGLAFVLFAIWLRLRSCAATLRLPIATVFVTMLYFAHLEALAVYALLVIPYELGIAWQRREYTATQFANLVIAGLPFLVPFAILVFGVPRIAGGPIEFGPPGHKFDLLFAPFDSEDRVLDIACFVAAIVVLAIGLQRRWLTIAPTMRAPLGTMGIVYLAMPTHLFTAAAADHRLPLSMGLTLVGSLCWKQAPEQIKTRLIGGAAAMFAVRLGATLLSWHTSDRIYASELRVVDAIPEGSRVAVASPSIKARLAASNTPIAHVPTIAIIRRDAFIPTLHAFPTQQPIALRPTARELADRLKPLDLWSYLVGHRQEIDQGALACYDFVLFVATGQSQAVERDELQPVAAEPGLELYRVASHEPCVTAIADRLSVPGHLSRAQH
jgi:hypothetical protein